MEVEPSVLTVPLISVVASLPEVEPPVWLVVEPPVLALPPVPEPVPVLSALPALSVPEPLLLPFLPLSHHRHFHLL